MLFRADSSDLRQDLPRQDNPAMGRSLQGRHFVQISAFPESIVIQWSHLGLAIQHVQFLICLSPFMLEESL